MSQFVLRRIFASLVTLFVLSVVTFIIIDLPPGDYITTYVSELRARGDPIDRQTINALRERYGFDQPILGRYAHWALNLLRGDFGRSFLYNQPVTELIGERVLLTVVVTGVTLLVSWAIAFPIGIYSALRPYTFGDYIFTFIGFIGLAVPGFLLTLIVMYIGFRYFGVTIGGLFSPEYVNAPWSAGRVLDLLQNMVVPVFILGLSGTAELIRILRANLLDELKKPYVTTARAKGLRERDLILRHPVRVALNPFISTAGWLLPELVSGSVIVASILGLPMIGPLLLDALRAQDMYLAGALILLLGVLTIIGTMISDLLLVWIDPRVRQD
ncbi:MAG: ABC transporter permease [Burkholderiales bacterium]|nr:ABC transporter permease [Anaerolineae bacterium]